MENSPLATLAPELRNRIYELVLTSKNNLMVVLPEYGHKRTTRNSSKIPALLTLLATCRIIHEEASQMLYASNRFQIHGNASVCHRHATRLENFVDQIGTVNAKALRFILLGTFSLILNSDQAKYLAQSRNLIRVRTVAKMIPLCAVITECYISGLDFGYIVSLDMQDIGEQWDKCERWIETVAPEQAVGRLREWRGQLERV